MGPQPAPGGASTLVTSPDFVDAGHGVHHHHLLLGPGHDVGSEDELAEALRQTGALSAPQVPATPTRRDHTQGTDQAPGASHPPGLLSGCPSLTASYSWTELKRSFWIRVMYSTSVSGSAASMLSNFS